MPPAIPPKHNPPRELRDIAAHLAGLERHLDAIGLPAEARVARDLVRDLGRHAGCWRDLWRRRGRLS